VFSIVRTLIFAVLALMSANIIANAGQATIGVLAHRGADFARTRWNPTIKHLNLLLPDTDFKLLPLTLEGVQAALENGEIDFLLTNPGHYYGVSDVFRLTKVASLKTDRKGKPVTGNRYGAVIFVRTSRSDIRTLGDLKGKSFAAVAPDAFGGFLAAAHIMQKNGISPANDLGGIKYLGFPQDEIVIAVINGEEDAGTVRTGVIESMIANKRISADDVRIINPQNIAGFNLMLSSELFPEWTFASTQKTSAKVRKDVAQALFSIAEDSDAARIGRYGGWNTPMYDGGVRELLLAIQRSGDRDDSETRNLLIVVLGVLGIIGGAIFLWVYVLPRQNRPAVKAPPVSKQFLRLTPRENEVLIHVVAGKTNKEVARELDISPKTVEFHRKHLMKKLGAENLADLVRIAVEREFLSREANT